MKSRKNGQRRGGTKTKPSSSTTNNKSNNANNDNNNIINNHIINNLDDTETSFSTISTLTETAPPVEGTERKEVLDAAELELLEARNRRQQQVDGAEQELREARSRRNQTAMTLKIATLEKNLEIAQNDRREHERTRRQKLALELEVAQAHEELVSKEEILLSKEMELVDLAKRLSDLQKVMDKTTTTLYRQPEVLSKALDEKNKELAEQYNAEKTAKETAERRCLELELQLKASNDKRNELTKQHMSEQTAREHGEKRCLELESRLKASNETNQELAALLRQKTSRIQSMDQSLDETEELREKALEYDYVVCLCDQLEKKVSVTILANEELMEEKESLAREIAELNTTVFDAELEREVELKSAQQQIESLTKQSLFLETELNALKQTNHTMTEENKTMAEKLSESNSSTEETIEFQNVRNENESLAARCESLETALNNLEDRNKTVVQEKKLLTKNMSELNSRIVRAEQQRKAQTMQLQHVQNQNLLLASRCKSLETELNNNACSSEDANSEREGNAEKLQTLQKQNELLASRCKSLETELSNMEETKTIATQKSSSLNNDTNPSMRSDYETRTTLIEEELEQLVKRTNETELNEGIDDTFIDALTKGAMEICYRKKYYNALKDEFTYLPSVARTCLDYSLLEVVEKEEEDQFPEGVFAALRSVAAETLKEDGDDDEEEYAAMLAVSVHTERTEESTEQDGSVDEETMEEESSTRNTPLLKDTTSSINRPTSNTSSVKDRIGKYQTKLPGFAREKTSTVEPVAVGSSAVNAMRRGTLKDRIGKFQTGSGDNAIPSGFQTIGLATLGLQKVVATDSANSKKDCDSVASASSFACCKDSAEHEHESDADSEDESSVDEDSEKIRVIGPDLNLIDVPMDSPSEKIGTLKLFVAEATDIPIADLRLGFHSDEQPLVDDFEVTAGAILAVLPLTVVVYLDSDSKLELSVFPGTSVSNIKDYITENTGTTPSKQQLYDFDDNLNNEMGDEEVISTDCTLRLSVC